VGVLPAQHRIVPVTAAAAQPGSWQETRLRKLEPPAGTGAPGHM